MDHETLIAARAFGITTVIVGVVVLVLWLVGALEREPRAADVQCLSAPLSPSWGLDPAPRRAIMMSENSARKPG